MTRRTQIQALAAGVLTASAAPAIEGKGPMIQQMLEFSLNEKRGITIFLAGQTIGGGVVKLSADAVELRSKEYTRIIVRIDAIQAIALL